jgi:glucose-6-phosphate isomerase
MLPVFPRCDETAAWPLLQEHYQQQAAGFNLRYAFTQDTDRAANMGLEVGGLYIDLSKNLWTDTTRTLLQALAEQVQLAQQRDALLSGMPVNNTEARPAWHTALRSPEGLHSCSPEVHGVLNAFLNFAERVRQPDRSPIRDVVNIGIGGSDLGPQMAVNALQSLVAPHLRIHFVNNIDADQLSQVLCGLSPQSTVFIVASKTFTTQETMVNAEAARHWFLQQGGTHVDQHFVALTSNTQAAREWGIHTSFGFADWVGGRYSIWGPIGLALAIAIGADGFRSFLAGAHAMDTHFAQAHFSHNAPVQLALLDVWYRNFYRFSGRTIAPYCQALSRLPAYLQQLEMESNGKGVDRHGRSLAYASSGVVWGEPGSCGQHAYFQMLHQGTDVIPVEFVAVRTPHHSHIEMHQMLLANCIAQSRALMLGKQYSDSLSPEPAALVPHKTFSGNRPSTTILLSELTPYSLGELIALYEHRVFCTGALWGINSFDQWGVELGKSLTRDLLSRWKQADLQGLDGSTAELLRRVMS